MAGEAARYLERVDTGGERAAIVLDIDETSLSNWPYLIAPGWPLPAVPKWGLSEAPARRVVWL